MSALLSRLPSSNLRLPICMSASPAALDRYPRGVAGHVAHPIRSTPIADLEQVFTTENTEHAEATGPSIDL